LEDIYTRLDVPGESFLDAVNSDGGREAARWAAAAGLPLEDLREQVSVGKQARQRIVEANLGLVYNEVYKLQRKTGRKNVDTGLSHEDLLQEGVFALLRAAEGFDVERKLRFSTYATVAVKRWLQRALQERTRLIRLPAYTYSKYGKIKRVKDKLALELGTVPPDSEIAEELRRQGIQQKWASEKGVRETLNVVERRPSSLDISVFSGFTDGPTSVQRKDRISDAGRSGDRVEEEIMVDAVRKDLFAGMALVLNEQEARAIELRFGLDDGEPRSRRMVGEAMGIPEQAAAALEFRSLRKLRSLLSQKLSATDFGDFLE
jgi:RNA polymerase primary sigma factor